MNTASSNPPSTRPSASEASEKRQPTRRALTALEQLSQHLPSAPRRIGSGVFRSAVDEYAGLERLDRAELDETDEG